MNQPQARRLAAILAADVVGYSALMGADQEGTLAALRQLRAEVFGPAVAGHRGKVVKSMGDGWLVEFGSAVDAVTCAMQVQDRLVGHELIKLRVGVHIGDVVHEDEDVFGDGVNVAARLETLAEPGAVVVSDAVHGALDGTLRPSFDDEGERRLKNIERPVRVWTRGGAMAGDAAGEEDTAITCLDIQPVQTSDDRAEVRELADALTSDIYGFLGHLQFTRARVTERPLANAFVLRSVLRARGDRLRLEIRLSAPGDVQHWNRRYDGSLAASFDWQDETAADAAGHFNGVIADEEMHRLQARPMAELNATEATALARMAMAADIVSSPGRIAGLHEHAIARAPDWGPAYAEAVFTYYTGASAGGPEVAQLWQDQIDGWFARAQALCGDDPRYEMVLGMITHIREPDPERARRTVTNALRRRPFDPFCLTYCGMIMNFAGEPGLARSCLENSLRFIHPSRHPATIINGLANAALQLGEDEEAIAQARRALSIQENLVPGWRVVAAAASHLGRTDEAAEAKAQLDALYPGDTLARIRQRSGWVDNVFTRRFFDGLRMAGMPEGEA